ncbi:MULTISPECIES: helix-turn-helix transcriptional regulator [Burkholderia]|uniref:Helix-turn-helix transcriptional regulator n=2 Tax=Burkholderia contaminans TaxID=488447 RepID=A0A1E3FH18_9BURK|nr:MULTISPECIES: helix-turn-helix transcriptional regulator [Burkholderia]RQU17812.1 LuxR family transcriptional regulator [Burkholderia cenocepacia]UTP24116.1 helix-turn-helix transcriptional regulator [Burkholderia sp. FXe9]KKL39694.1 transcriptional regulator [Burkholderia contaminans LMG 23361]MBA9833166.1 LuxR family transcriptional regulator [Burkholderia contaminans]MBA9837612.1 LuxR family transcriptional regulator [Burkholderia contaminans]
MKPQVHDLTLDELRLFGDIIGRLEELGPIVDVRRVVLSDLTRLLRSDFCVSYNWDAEKGTYVDPIAVNVDSDHVRRYTSWYQHNDPMTAQLCKLRRATLVEEVMDRPALEKSEFYNEFLAQDGLHHGINVFVFDGERQLSDLRIWRTRNRPEFEMRDKLVLDAIEPFLCRAIKRRAGSATGLTDRESEIAQLVAKGCTDQDIGRLLCISLSTVRTHLRRIMDKKGFSNRAELAACVAAAVTTAPS